MLLILGNVNTSAHMQIEIQAEVLNGIELLLLASLLKECK